MNDVNDPHFRQKVVDLLIEADDEGLALREEPKQRAFMNITRVMAKLGVDGYVLAGSGQPVEIDLIRELQKHMFREADIGTGAVHFGAFMFRDLFARFSIPVVFGRCAIEPLTHIDFSESQLRWMCFERGKHRTIRRPIFRCV